MDIPSLVEKTIGIYFFIIAISLIIRPDLWLNMIKRITLENGSQRTYFFFSLFIGIVVTLTHNIWDFTSAILVTVFGWALLIKSSIAFIYPEFFKKVLPSSEKMDLYIRIGGVILASLCIWILIPFYGPGVKFF